MKHFLIRAASILLAAIMPFAAVGLFVGLLVGLYLLNPILGSIVYAAVGISAFGFFVFVMSQTLFGLFTMSTGEAGSKTEVSEHENR